LSDFDASVVGAGPNGLSAAVELARSGRRVLLVEGADEIGGGTRTKELTLPGFLHDICSAIHPSGVASPFFNEIGLEIDWVQPPIPFTHPLDDGRVVALHRSVEETAAQMGQDAPKYTGLMGPLVEKVDMLVEDVLSPMTINPKHKAAYARIAAIGGLPASLLVKRFESDEARAVIAGLAAHSIAPFNAASALPSMWRARDVPANNRSPNSAAAASRSPSRSASSSSPSSSRILASTASAPFQSKPTPPAFSPSRCARNRAGMARGTPANAERSTAFLFLRSSALIFDQLSRTSAELLTFVSENTCG